MSEELMTSELLPHVYCKHRETFRGRQLCLCGIHRPSPHNTFLSEQASTDAQLPI